MSYNDLFQEVLWFVIGVLLAFTVFVFRYNKDITSLREMKYQAITRGYATYQVDDNGEPVFVWKDLK